MVFNNAGIGAFGATPDLAPETWHRTIDVDLHAIFYACRAAIPELRIVGNPDASLLAFGSDTLDVMAVGDRMDEKGWHLDRQRNPDALHLMVTPNHARIVQRFLDDLRDAVAHHGTSRGVEARYS